MDKKNTFNKALVNNNRIYESTIHANYKEILENSGYDCKTCVFAWCFWIASKKVFVNWEPLN